MRPFLQAPDVRKRAGKVEPQTRGSSGGLSPLRGQVAAVSATLNVRSGGDGTLAAVYLGGVGAPVSTGVSGSKPHSAHEPS